MAECPILPHLSAGGGTGGGAVGGGELSAMALLVFRIVVRAAGLAAQIADHQERPGDDIQTISLPDDFVLLFTESQQDDDKKKKKKRKAKSKSLGG